MIDIADFDTDPNPIDAFGRTDALFDMYLGIEDAPRSYADRIDANRNRSRLPDRLRLRYRALSRARRAGGVAVRNDSIGIPARGNAFLQTARAHLRLHPDESSNELTIDRLAALVSMSPFHFARCFKQTTGLTPHQFVTRERIERAKALLAQARLPISDIALAVGFSSQSHFADVYRRITGTSPRRARNRATKR
jgi:transcriptional regulator GlxA family with amidase domain